MQDIKEMLKQTYPSMIGSNIDENGNVILSNFTLEKNEYIKDNMIYCAVCNQKKLFVGNDWQNKLVARRCVCKCYEEEQLHSYPAHGTSSHTGSAAANR